MLYNKTTRQIKVQEDCFSCPHFNTKEKKCYGFGKNCFEYDMKTKTVIDPITKLPIKL